MVNKKSLATFVRTVGNQVISGFKHFLNNVKIGGDLIIDPNSLGAPATNVLTVDGSGVVKTATAFSGISVDSVSKVKHEVKAGVAINKGQAVYVTGADGTNMIVGLASNATEATSSKTMGLLESTVAINGKTNVITEGLLSGLDTSMASAGDVVWLGTGGNLLYGLANKPYAPAHLVFIGIVTRSNSNNGEIFVKVQNGFELNEIHDVDLKTTVPVNGHILGFDGTLWVNKTIAGWLGYTPANAANESNWNAAYNDKINSAAVTGTTTKTLTLTQQDGGTITASWTDINTDAVTSVFGRTGAVVATSGDYTTAQVTESGNLYFTNARGIGSTLTGYASGAGVISSADTILSAIQKLNGNIGALVTGVSSVNGLSGAVTLTTTNIAEGTNLYYTEARVNANTNVAANTAARHNAVTIGTANGLSLSTQVLSLGLASASTNGALSSTDWTTFNSKQAALNGTGFVKITGTTISYDNSTYYLASNPNGYTSNVGTVTSITATAGTGISISGSPITTSGTLTITNTAPDQTVVLTSGTGISVTGTYPNFTITNSSPSSGGTVTSITTTAPITGGTITSTGTIGITQAGASTDGYLSSTDWTTFNNKQNALTNPITGTGTTNYLPKFTGTTTLGNSQIFDNGTNVGIGTSSPVSALSIYKASGNAYIEISGNGNTLGSTSMLYGQDGGNNGYVWNRANAPVYFGTNNSVKMFLNTNGYLGIGTTTPAQKLEVNDGDALIRNAFIGLIPAYGVNYASFSHNSRSGAGQYSLLSGNAGETYVNSVNGQPIYFRHNNIDTAVITSAGNVGIGTTSPSEKLSVVGGNISLGAGYKLQYSSTAYITPENNVSGAEIATGGVLTIKTGGTTERVRVDASGNVGIGTVNPGAKLDVVGSAGIRVNEDGIGTKVISIRSDFAGVDPAINVSTNNALLLQTNNTERMRITSTGNVGIGTTSPGNLLTIGGNTRIVTGTTQGLFAYDASTGGAFIWSLTRYTDSNANDLNVNTRNGFGIRVGVTSLTNSGHQFYINNSGNVGIGTTSPTGKLSVVGDGTEYSNIVLRHGSNQEHLIYASTNIQYNLIGSGAPTWIWGQQGGAERMRLNNTGLGIGTASPQAKLDVTDGDFIVRDDANVNRVVLTRFGGIELKGNGTSFRTVGTPNTDALSLATNNTSRIYITSAGNVGIGTTSPAFKLDINGASNSSPFRVLSTNTTSLRTFFEATSGNVEQHFLYTGNQDWVLGLDKADSNKFKLASADDGFASAKLTVTTSGNVGIGTSSPAARLNIAGNLGSTVGGGNSAIKMTNTDTGNFASISAGIVGITNSGMEFSVDGNRAAVISGTGNVGIGTTSPATRLHVDASGHALVVSNDTGNRRIYFGTGTLGEPDIQAALSNGTARELSINAAGGNVGIGVVSPTQKLHVSGNIRVTGAYYDSSNSAGSSGQVLSSTGSGTDWVSLSEITGVDGTGTANYVAKWSDADTIANSQIFDNGTNVGIGTATPTNKFQIGSISGYNGNAFAIGNGTDQFAIFQASSFTQFYTNGGFLFATGNTESVRITSTGNVGIGTTSPGYKLEVSGTVYINGDGDLLFDGSTGGDGFQMDYYNGQMYLGNKLGTSWHMVMKDNGNVGIGTTSPDSKLHISTTSSNPFRMVRTGGAATNFGYEFGNGAIGLYDYTNSSYRYYITSGGNVGIGTTSPNGKLEIVANPTGNTVLLGRTGGTSSIKALSDNGGYLALDSTGGATILNHYVSDNVWLVTGGGNVGIGTTSPNEKLTVSGKGYFNPYYPIVLTGKGSPEYGTNITLASDTGSTQGAVRIWSRYDGTGYAATTFERATTSQAYSSDPQLLTYSESMRISGAGNVGIGTTSPSAKLEVYDATNPKIYISGGGLSSKAFVSGYAGNFDIGTEGSNPVTFYTNAIERVRIMPTGNVGIGTTSPAFKLDINAGSNAGTFLQGSSDVRYHVFSTSTSDWVGYELRSSNVNSFAGGMFRNNASNNRISIWNKNLEAISILDTGNVGIGTTSPSHKLQVVTNAVAGKQNMAAIDRTAGNLIRFTNPQYSTDASMGLLLRVFPDSDARQGAGIIASGGANNATTDLDLFVTTSPDGLGGTSYSAVKINGLNGNVGIGTTSPSAKLQVGGSTKITGGDWPTANAGLEFNYVGNTSYIGSYDRTNSVYKGLFLFADNMTFETGASIRMYITSGGNVGIGTTSPSAKLHVIGNATVSATLSTANAKISGTLADSFNQVGTAGQVLSSTGNGIEWVTGGGGSGTTITVKDDGTTVSSSISTLDFVGSNVQATASGSTATVAIRDNVGTGSQYLNAATTNYAIPGSYTDTVQIDGTDIIVAAPNSPKATETVIAILTFGILNVVNSDAFNAFYFRLYNASTATPITDTEHRWSSYMSANEPTTVATFHIPIKTNEFAQGDNIYVQCQTSVLDAPEIYYCALSFIKGTE